MKTVFVIISALVILFSLFTACSKPLSNELMKQAISDRIENNLASHIMKLVGGDITTITGLVDVEKNVESVEITKIGKKDKKDGVIRWSVNANIKGQFYSNAKWDKFDWNYGFYIFKIEEGKYRAELDALSIMKYIAEGPEKDQGFTTTINVPNLLGR